MREYTLLLAVLTAMARGQTLTPVWVEAGEGRTLARVVVNHAGDCPVLRADGASLPMSLRQPVPTGLRPACEAAIPAGTRSAFVNGQALALPSADPSRIVVIGDTGCRIKGPRVQDCNDPAKWPFKTIAGRAAAAKPQLVIHVGDYLYREEKCPQGSDKLCAGTPSGDVWETWDADFFKPAAKLLAAAPWVFARGNHENCERSWRGWFYYLDPRPFPASCQPYSAPYIVKLGGFEVAVLDTSSAIDTRADPAQVTTYAAQLASLHVRNAWLVDHHPFWGVSRNRVTAKTGQMTPALDAAWEKASPKGIDLILSGHTHLFEIVSFDHGRPPQIVAGDGGTDLEQPILTSPNGMTVHGLAISASQAKHEFGYTVLGRTAAGWSVELKGAAGRTLVTGRIEGGRVIFPK
jgi:predicted phosphodiesterase